VLAVFVLGSGIAGAEELDLIDRFKIRDKSEGFSEPSGLAMSGRDGALWSVSDSDAVMHLLKTDGTLTENFALPMQYGSDLEGVAERPPDGSVLMVQERDRTIVLLDPEQPTDLKWFSLN
jgi:uncharacterized protein YjiK